MIMDIRTYTSFQETKVSLTTSITVYCHKHRLSVGDPYVIFGVTAFIVPINEMVILLMVGNDLIRWRVNIIIMLKV